MWTHRHIRAVPLSGSGVLALKLVSLGSEEQLGNWPVRCFSQPEVLPNWVYAQLSGILAAQDNDPSGRRNAWAPGKVLPGTSLWPPVGAARAAKPSQSSIWARLQKPPRPSPAEPRADGPAHASAVPPPRPRPSIHGRPVGSPRDAVQEQGQSEADGWGHSVRLRAKLPSPSLWRTGMQGFPRLLG